jgi:transposase-like protein
MVGRCSWHHQFPVCFKWRQFEPEVILLAVGRYLRFSLSYRDGGGVARRAGTASRSRHGVAVGSAVCARIAAVLTPPPEAPDDSWRVDETYIQVKGKSVYLYGSVATLELR